MSLGPTIETREHFANRAKGEAWYLPIDEIDPAGSDDNFAYFRNDGIPLLEIIAGDFFSTVAGAIKMERCTGSPTGGTAVVPLVANGNSGRLPVATFEAGVDITTLTDAGIVGVAGIPTALGNQAMQFPVGLILKKDEGVLLNWSAATGIITGWLLVIEVPEQAE